MAADVKLINKLALLVNIEATVGTIVIPVAANAIRVSEVQLTPVEGDEVEEGVVRPFFGASEKTLVTLYSKVAFKVGFAGVKTAGDIPGYAALLRACAASSTNTPADSTVFAPVTDDIESVTIYTVIDGLQYRMAGARGTFKINAQAKQIPKIEFEFTGALLPVLDVPAMPAVSYTKFCNPLGMNKTNTTLVIDGYTAACNAFNFDAGNRVVKQDLTNVDATEVTGRTSTLSVTIRNTSVATKNWIELATQGAKVALTLKHGQGALNTVSISAPTAQVGKPSFGEDEGVQMITLPLTLIPSDAGNDEWSITV